MNISYTPPVTDNDVNIVVGDPAWRSPDIWVDFSPKNGFDVESGRVPEDRGDDPVVNEVNRIYFRIHNPGPGNAHDLTVQSVYPNLITPSEVNRISMFGPGEKIYHFSAGTDITDYVEWTPEYGTRRSPFLYLVEIPNVLDRRKYGTVTSAQQKHARSRSSHSSPYETVAYSFGVSNPFDFPPAYLFNHRRSASGMDRNY